MISNIIIFPEPLRSNTTQCIWKIYVITQGIIAGEIPISTIISCNLFETSQRSRLLCIRGFVSMCIDEYEFFIAGTTQGLTKLPPVELKVGNDMIKPSSSVRNLGIIFDNHMSMTQHINSLISSVNFHLTGGNWQKWKRVFLTYPCHEIYRDGAVGLKSCKNTWKITIFVKMWNLGQNRENLIFCQ